MVARSACASSVTPTTSSTAREEGAGAGHASAMFWFMFAPRPTAQTSDAKTTQVAPAAASLVRLPVVEEGDEWEELARQVRAARDPWSSPAFGTLYELAQQLGVPILRRQGIGLADAEDLVSDLVSSKLELIVAAKDGVRAYYCQALKNRARDRLKKKGTLVAEDRPPDAPGEAHTTHPDEAIEARLKLAVVRSLLTEREQNVYGAIYAGVDREEVAAAFETSRDNIDQIVRRARVKLKKAGLA